MAFRYACHISTLVAYVSSPKLFITFLWYLLYAGSLSLRELGRWSFRDGSAEVRQHYPRCCGWTRRGQPGGFPRCFHYPPHRLGQVQRLNPAAIAPASTVAIVEGVAMGSIQGSALSSSSSSSSLGAGAAAARSSPIARPNRAACRRAAEPALTRDRASPSDNPASPDPISAGERCVSKIVRRWPCSRCRL